MFIFLAWFWHNSCYIFINKCTNLVICVVTYSWSIFHPQEAVCTWGTPHLEFNFYNIISNISKRLKRNFQLYVGTYGLLLLDFVITNCFSWLYSFAVLHLLKISYHIANKQPVSFQASVSQQLIM